MKKRDFVKGPVNHEHLKDSALHQVLYSKLQCSKVTTLVWSQTYGLEIEAYFSTIRTVCKTEQFQFAMLNNLRIFS